MTTVTNQTTPCGHPVSLPATEQLLAEGGDARIALDPVTGLNKYGCPPHPDLQLLALGSSTASVISESGFAAADQLRNRLLPLLETETAATIYAREMQRARSDLLQLCELADLPDIAVTFASSGTDLHLITAQYVSVSDSKPMLAVMMGAAETGSNVATALSGRHFSSRAASGCATTEGTPIAGSAVIEVAKIPIRLSDGRPRPTSEVDAEVTALTEAAAAKGQRVLLILIDQSKTGMIAPGPACAADLKRRLPDNVDVLIDACQFRISPSTLRTYLQQDFMVALTGSKFVGGPTFSAALLIPPSTAQRLKAHPLPPALSAYSSRADWPSDWAAAEGLGHAANFGLLLRWEAALQELRTFRAVPQAAITHFLTTFANAIRQRLVSDPCFEPLPVPPLNRSPLIEPDNWDHLPTIFPFLLFHTINNTEKLPLSHEETGQVYHWLQCDLAQQPGFDIAGLNGQTASLRCQLGQPVACGIRNGIAVSALRICVSARMIVDATSQNGQGITAVIAQALAALDKTAFLAALDKPLKPELE